MGSSDIPPPHAPPWLIPLSTLFLGTGVLFWVLTYILMTRRGLATQSYGMPIVGLAINVSWEIIYGFYVAEAWLEKSGFLFWLLLDLGVIYTTVRYAPLEWRDGGRQVVGRHMGWILGFMLLVGCWGHYAFASWWLSRPGVGVGDKTGKWFHGEEGYDTTELAYWSAGVSQLVLSAGSLAMLLVRGHSGGTGYVIWFCRFVGSVSGMGLCNALLWWYWPEAHGYFLHPLGVFMCGLSLLCDLSYPFLLWQVRRTERMLPDGRLVAGDVVVSSKVDKTL
ncbi:uncharacterized protein BCR38DRAFT_447456 [Pseudomassariella vexata]|uniref:Integral membrane protein n=1 Tax=Pseudomassariella vexata TaxID=1141098 RepID=A0A1Y2DGU7_9PEZI|nr:uncharacterized protein BCR38DRAFT_447456 [Pseudomassariella vexata]ORY58490.1 hypothetical protein BCR38DRAFT_447456 [Pseudomassariella vexata]